MKNKAECIVLRLTISNTNSICFRHFHAYSTAAAAEKFDSTHAPPATFKQTKYFQNKQRGRARTQVPTTRNYTLELPTLGVIAGVNPVEVQ